MFTCRSEGVVMLLCQHLNKIYGENHHYDWFVMSSLIIADILYMPIKKPLYNNSNYL